MGKNSSIENFIIFLVFMCHSPRFRGAVVSHLHLFFLIWLGFLNVPSIISNSFSKIKITSHSANCLLKASSVSRSMAAIFELENKTLETHSFPVSLSVGGSDNTLCQSTNYQHRAQHSYPLRAWVRDQVSKSFPAALKDSLLRSPINVFST